MKSYKRKNSILISLSVFTFALAVSLFAYPFVNRNKPILYRTHDGDEDWFASIFIQNPFRDKTKELVAEEFLQSIKGKTINESLKSFKVGFFVNTYETGKLVKWDLWNRFEGDTETSFVYAIYRGNPLAEPDSKNYLLSFIILELRKENSAWKVTKYSCLGTSNNS